MSGQREHLGKTCLAIVFVHQQQCCLLDLFISLRFAVSDSTERAIWIPDSEYLKPHPPRGAETKITLQIVCYNAVLWRIFSIQYTTTSIFCPSIVASQSVTGEFLPPRYGSVMCTCGSPGKRVNTAYQFPSPPLSPKIHAKGSCERVCA